MARKPVDLRQYLRRPDRDFWLDLLKAPPRATETSSIRRERLTRYALGGALVFTLPYTLLYGIGMWMGSLHQHRAARLLLMVTLEIQILLLAWLTGPALNMIVLAPVAAVLARVLFTVEEHRQQVLFIGVPVLTLIACLLLFDVSHIDFAAVPTALLTFTRVFNALLATACVLLILGVFEREVLRSEGDLVEARERSDRLLHAVLPRRIAEQLRDSPAMIANRHPEVTVLFADIAGFTPWSSQQDPHTVVAMLEKVFSRFDARVIASLALELLDEVRQVREETGIDLNLRVGIHSGEVIAGVIGAMRFSYDVWGDTVNIASRMESHGAPGRIHMSGDTRRRLGATFHCELRGVVNVKGKGEMETWWLSGTLNPAG